MKNFANNDKPIKTTTEEIIKTLSDCCDAAIAGMKFKKGDKVKVWSATGYLYSIDETFYMYDDTLKFPFIVIDDNGNLSNWGNIEKIGEDDSIEFLSNLECADKTQLKMIQKLNQIIKRLNEK